MRCVTIGLRFSALQRAEIAEICCIIAAAAAAPRFSALQRAEIAEIRIVAINPASASGVSVLFNEPKLLKSAPTAHYSLLH